jgi:4-hydroxy-4-methyl-2-oxoglutarate aldolase
MAFNIPASSLTPEQVNYLKTVDSPTIANAVETFKVRDRTDGYIGGSVGSLFPDLGVMVGQALTVKMINPSGPPAARDGYWDMWEALEKMPSPSVLVMQDASGRPSRYAMAGEVMATLARRLGAVGLVTNGGYRDIDEVHALGLHYFASQVVVSHGNFGIVEVGEPVTLDGQTIKTGDILQGDRNGIVIVPPETLDGMKDAVDGIRDRESRLMNFIKGDKFTLADAKAGNGY